VAFDPGAGRVGWVTDVERFAAANKLSLPDISVVERRRLQDPIPWPSGTRGDLYGGPFLLLSAGELRRIDPNEILELLPPRVP
jgi:hypothetical protein